MTDRPHVDPLLDDLEEVLTKLDEAVNKLHLSMENFAAKIDEMLG